MKKIVALFVLLSTSIVLLNSFLPTLSITTTSTWCDFGLSPLPHEKEKCILTGLITFASKKPYTLNSFVLHWNGKPISSLEASLYVKPYNKKLITIKKYHVCDGNWNSNKQNLIFTPHQKIVGRTTYHLVVTIPFDNEKNLKDGSFSTAPSDSVVAFALN